MKYVISKVPVLVVVLSLFLVIGSTGEDFTWNSTIFHFTDGRNLVEETENQEINDELKELIPELKFDIAIMISGSEYVKDHVYEEYLASIYSINDFGYGINRDGILMGINPDTELMAFHLEGRAREIFTEPVMDGITQKVQLAYQEEGYAAAVHAYIDYAEEIVRDASSSCLSTENEYAPSAFVLKAVSINSLDTPTDIVIDGITMPEWFRDDASFVNFNNDPSTPRVVDNAGLLTDEEEQQLMQRLLEIAEKTGQDIVLLTDETSYGLDNELYEMSFYIYQGYGFGEDHDGLMCFINMDPENREMCSTAFGAMERYFTRSGSYGLDDILYDHLVVQDYFGGFLEWADGVENLIRFGDVSVPVWFRNYVDGIDEVTARDEQVTGYRIGSNIVDEARFLSEEDRIRLALQMEEIQNTYGLDVVVYLGEKAYSQETDRSVSEEERIQNFLDLFYTEGGYGSGEDHSGILLGILILEDTGYHTTIRLYGAAKERFGEKALKKLNDAALLSLSSEIYDNNIGKYVDYLETYLRTGRVPHSFILKILCLIGAAISGVYTAYYSTEREKKKHTMVKVAARADEYLVPGSFKVLSSQEIFEYSTTTTKKIYHASSGSSSSSSSSSSSRSSYHHSSHSVGGHSGTTSRKKF